MKTKKTRSLVLLGLVIGCALILAGCPGPSVGYGDVPVYLTGTVSITGTPQVGHQLTANTANLDGSGTITFQWRRGATIIPNATASTYIVQVADEGQAITVRVTRTGFAGEVISDPTTPVPTPPTHAIVLDPSGNHTFPSRPYGYAIGDRVAHTVTVRNGGSQATGALTLELDGTGEDSFTLSTNEIASILVGGSITFTVIPNHGLEVGTHTATVAVDGTNITTPVTFDVTFVVAEAPAYGIALDPSGDHTFPSLPLGYVANERVGRTVRVNNIGENPTGLLHVELSGPNAATSFTLSASTLASIGVDDYREFTVYPSIGLAAGTYTATVTVSGGANIQSRYFDVTFVVTNPIAAVSLVGIVAPATGAAPIGISDVEPSVAIASSSLTWAPAISGGFLAETEYTLTIVLTLPTTHRWNNTVTVTLDAGAVATAIVSTTNNRILTITTVPFPQTGPVALTPITQLEITGGIPAMPSYGADVTLSSTLLTFDSDPLAGYPSLVVGSRVWILNSQPLPPPATFSDGTWFFRFEVQAAPGHTFTASTTLIPNDVQRVSTPATGETIQLQIEFNVISPP